jgi:Fe-S-cluster containining protein
MLDLREQVRAAASRADVRDAVARVYADLQREIDARRPICSASGRCCRLEEYGHRLYVTTLELAAFVAGLPENPNVPAWDGTGCPFQVAKLCSVHTIRPFGCRMFFCDATSTQWQNERYEQFHADLKRLHGELNVPYLYVEWRQALAALGLATSPQTGASPDLSRA